MEYTVDVVNDPEPSSPREYDNLGTMVCFHGRYSLGDEHGLEIEEAKNLENSKDVVALPLYLYDHSGLTMATSPFSCPWDSGKVGFIYVDKEKICKEYGVKKVGKRVREKALKALQSEVEAYDKYLRGEAYGYEIKDSDGDVVDSCWGFDDEDECRRQGQMAAHNRYEVA